MNLNQINPLVFAYLGDSIYELNIRIYLISKGISNVNDLQKTAKNFVSAKKQSLFLNELMNQNMLNEEEISVVKRARNTKTNSHPKNTDIITYKYATALEALIGYLYLSNNKKRIEEIIEFILKNSEENLCI